MAKTKQLEYLRKNIDKIDIDKLVVGMTEDSESEEYLKLLIKNYLSGAHEHLLDFFQSPEEVVITKKCVEYLENNFILPSEKSVYISLNKINKIAHLIVLGLAENSQHQTAHISDYGAGVLVGRAQLLVNQSKINHKDIESASSDTLYDFEGLKFQMPESGFWFDGEIKIDEPRSIITKHFFLKSMTQKEYEFAKENKSKYALQLQHNLIDGHGKSDYSTKTIFLKSINDIESIKQQIDEKIKRMNNNSNEQFTYRVNELSL